MFINNNEEMISLSKAFRNTVFDEVINNRIH